MVTQQMEDVFKADKNKKWQFGKSLTEDYLGSELFFTKEQALDHIWKKLGIANEKFPYTVDKIKNGYKIWNRGATYYLIDRTIKADEVPQSFKEMFE